MSKETCSMSKETLITQVAGKLGTTKAEAARAIDSVVEAIGDIVGGGTPLRLAPLGSFNLKHKPGRAGRNPRTGEDVHIAARDVIVFKQSKKA
jgi:DNA-binding protein HU-beta